ncbi:MAG: biopolymer transporter ExbD [Phycisphaerales bacterium]
MADGSAHSASQAAAPPEARAAVAALQAMADALPQARVGPRLRAPRPRPRSRRDRFGPTVLRANMTPMIDVVFLLLVFFISTTRFATGEEVIGMDLARRTAAAPRAGAAETQSAPLPPPPADPFEYREEALELRVLPGGRIEAGSPLRRSFDALELRALLESERRGPEHPSGMLRAGDPIVIAPADGATWQDAVEALNAVVGAGYTNVGFDQRRSAK